MRRFTAAGLYLVTSAFVTRGRSTESIVESALKGGVRLVQLREKELSSRELTELARRIKRLTDDHGALLLINDRLDVALAVGADGVHLGQDDVPVEDARRLAPDLIIGASSHSVEEAVAAEGQGASYVNIGPLFATGTKAWTREFLGQEGLKEISGHLKGPFTVMGGIKAQHLPDLVKNGARTIAVVTAVTAADDPERAARELLKTILELRA